LLCSLVGRCQIGFVVPYSVTYISYDITLTVMPEIVIGREPLKNLKGPRYTKHSYFIASKHRAESRIVNGDYTVSWGNFLRFMGNFMLKS
jgi:hypothetical protein